MGELGSWGRLEAGRYVTGQFGAPNGKPSLQGSVFMGPAGGPLENGGGVCGVW